MPSDVESEALILDCAREAADILRILIEYEDATSIFGEFGGGSQCGGSGADNDYIAIGVCIQIFRNPPSYLNTAICRTADELKNVASNYDHSIESVAVERIARFRLLLQLKSLLGHLQFERKCSTA